MVNVVILKIEIWGNHDILVRLSLNTLFAPSKVYRSGDGWSTAELAVVVFGFVTRTQWNCGVAAFGFVTVRQQNCGMLSSFFDSLKLAFHCLYISLCSAKPSGVLVFSFCALHIFFLFPFLMEFLTSSFKYFLYFLCQSLDFSWHFLSPASFLLSSPRP